MSTWLVHPCGYLLSYTAHKLYRLLYHSGRHDLDGVKELVSDSLTALGLFTPRSPPPNPPIFSFLSPSPIQHIESYMYTLRCPAYNSRKPCMYMLRVTLGWIPAYPTFP